MQELDRLRDLADPERAARASARHKRDRETLGITPAALEEVVAEWRAERDLDARIALAEALWDSDVHEARLAAARLLVQARMRPDDAAWAAIMDWAPQIDGAEIDDAVMTAAARRVVADPTRLDQITAWAGSRNPWLRRGVMLATLPWAKMNNPKPEDLEIREKVLQLMLRLASDRHGGV
ncbi:MAG: DNA alkylation repair protein, partial [Paracoccus marcusii]